MSTEVQEEEERGEETSKEVWQAYHCHSLPFGEKHPGNIVEAASLAAVQLPHHTFPIRDSLRSQIRDGKLSALQLEGVSYACQRHCNFLPDGRRCGFFIGDGAGVGKGRQISAIIFDSIVRGRPKHLWFSSSTDLRLDAERDMRDIGCYVSVYDGIQQVDRSNKALGNTTEKGGVVFSTYATLVSAGKGQRSRTRENRLDQLVLWCGGENFDGCIIFDECHKAKNHAAGKSTGSKVAANVIELQRLLPRARVVYCSATGVSELQHLAYMNRLGLWGRGAAFPDFERFVEAQARWFQILSGYPANQRLSFLV